MTTCSECIWWGRAPADEWEKHPGDHPGGELRRGIGATWSMRPCMHPKVGGGSYHDEQHDSADAAVSYEQIATGPTFCCIHAETA